MPRTLQQKRQMLSVDNSIAFTRDLEVGHALLLHKSGNAQVLDAKLVIQQARKRIE